MEMRQCPTLNGDQRPLIAHRIPTGECQSRQEGYYHKCARCTHRGSTLGPEPEPVEILAVRPVAAAREEPVESRNGHVAQVAATVAGRNGHGNGTNGHHGNGRDTRAKVTAAAQREFGAY